MESRRVSGKEIPDQKFIRDFNEAVVDYFTETVIGVTDKATGEYYRILDIYPSVDDLTILLEIDTSEINND